MSLSHRPRGLQRDRLRRPTKRTKHQAESSKSLPRRKVLNGGKRMNNGIESKNVVDALDRIRYSLEHDVPHDVIIEQPQLTIGPVEHVLAFKINEHHFL